MNELAPVTHIAGPEITIGGRRMRQRCSWCGAILLDYDLANMAAPVEPCSHDGCHKGHLLGGSYVDEPCPHCHGTGHEPWSPATYPVGGLVRVSGGGGFRANVVLDNTDQLPDDACGSVDDEVTR